MSYFWDFKVQDPKGSTENSNDNKQQQGKSNNTGLNMHPKTTAEMNATLNELIRQGKLTEVAQLKANWDALHNK